MPLRQRYETLLVFDPNRSPATANVWIAHPALPEEQALGKLVVVSTIAGTDRINLDVINLIQEELRTSYYQSLDTKPERAFEHALQQTNRRLHQVIVDGVGQWIESANILVAACWRETLIISAVGSVHAFLLRHGRIHDVIGPTDRPAVNPVRMFSHLVSGQLQTEDQLLICTPSLLDYFSLEKLRRTLIDGNPSAAVHQWETILLGAEQQTSVAAVVVQTLDAESLVATVSRPVAQSTLASSAPQVSMDQLIAKEQATARLLAPSIWPAIRDVFNQLGIALNRLGRRLILRKPPRRRLQPGTLRPTAPINSSPAIWPRLIRSVVSGFQRLIGGLRDLRPRRTTIENTTTPMTMAPVLRRRRWSFNQLVIWFQHLSPRQQALAGLAVIMIVVLAATILPRVKTASTPTTPADINASITDHLAKARAALLYNGQDTARQEVTAAQTLNDKLPKRRTQDKATRTANGQAIGQILSQLAKRTIFTNPTVVAQLAPIAPLARPQQIYLLGKKLITFDPDRSITVSASIDGAQPTVINNRLDTGAPLSGAISGIGTVIFTTDRQGFAELDLATGAWKPIDSAWPTAKPRIQSIATYQNRVYALNIADQTIVRFNRSANSLGAGAKWLKETAVLSAARGLAVDGSIYVLQPDGLVEVYANGRRSAFTLTVIDPPLNNATRLWTDANSKNIYLVDPANQRVAVFSKTGQLVDQYTSTAWSNLRDVAVNEKTKTAYVLSGTTITSFSLIH